MTTILLALLALAMSLSPAAAEQLTLACTFEGGTHVAVREADINQVIIDTDSPLVDLRVAQTIGTTIPINWTFRNDAAQKDSIQLTADRSRISVAAIRYGQAAVISYDRASGLLNWSQADGSRAFRYKCNK